MKLFYSKTSRFGFTLFEIILALGIISILGTVSVLALNPAQIFMQARDTNRISDMQTLNNALLNYQIAGGTNLGSTNIIYTSLPSDQANCSDLLLPTPPVGWSYACKPSATFRNVDGTGWIPANFTIPEQSVGALFSSLPVDPVNTVLGDLYYTYIHGTDWAVSATMESIKNLANIAPNDGGSSDTRFEIGKDISLDANILNGGEVVLSSAKNITAFSFASPSATGVITGTSISVTVPNGTNVTALVPTISVSAAASVSPLSGAAQDFTSPVTYTVTAENSSTQNYIVTVTPSAPTSQSWLSPGTYSFVVPVGVVSINIDMRGSGGGGGGGGYFDGEVPTESQDGGGGGGGSGSGTGGVQGGAGGAAGSDSVIKRASTILAGAKTGAGGAGATGYFGGGAGGTAGINSSAGLTLIAEGGGSAGLAGLGIVGPPASYSVDGSVGFAGDRVTGIISVSSGETLTVIVGLPGSGGLPNGGTGGSGRIDISW